MHIQFVPQGIYIEELDLWLDPREGVANAWISHGHSDHARGGHGRVIGTPRTLEIYRIRLAGVAPAGQILRPVAYGESMDWNGAKLTAFPAAHILGAAQLLIELGDERVVYTGDIKLQPPLCGVETAVPACERLIVESTFGLPIFRFLDREEGRRRMVEFARECLGEGDVPVFIGYPLGRGQEIGHTLCQAGVEPAVHGSIARFIPQYEAEGYPFPGWCPYTSRCTGKALVVTPGFRNYLQAAGERFRFAYVSGWAAMDNARSRVGAEALIPYSDHAGFPELLSLVERSGAREVDVVHGYTEPFARILRDRGLEARAPQGVLARTSAEDIEG